MTIEPQKVKISCLGCSVESFARCGESMKETEYKTGFFAVMTIRTTFSWLCPSCVDRMIPLLRAMTEIVGTSDIYWGHIDDMMRRMETHRRSSGEDLA